MKEYHTAIITAWVFMKNHFPPCNTDEWWDRTTEEARKASEGNPFLLGLLVAVLHELRRAVMGEG